jgi:hypothetical protein
VRRLTYRRIIVLCALLCQVLTAGVVHIPAARAAETAQATMTSEHCHDDAASSAAQASDHAGMSGTHVWTHDHFGHTAPGGDHSCKSGVCTCVCAHGVAGIPAAASGGSPLVSHPPLLLSSQLASVSERITPFFRPPI